MKIKNALELRHLKLCYKINAKKHNPPKVVTKKYILKYTGKACRTVPSLTREIGSFIESGKPMMMARLGNTEGRIAGQYCEKLVGLRKKYDKEWMNWLFTTSGFFADDMDREEAADRYAKMTLDGLKECDFLSAMFPQKVYMPYLFHHYCPDTQPTFSDMGPYYDNIPTDETWIKYLGGKKVLAINSFAESIQMQYPAKRKLIANSPEYELPEFELKTYKTLCTQLDERPMGFKNFFEALEFMLGEIKQIDFDIALVGCGAYGFPMSVEIKKWGKQVFEICSATPKLFGIYDNRDVTQGAKYLNENWIRPIESKPKNYKQVENGCYW